MTHDPRLINEQVHVPDWSRWDQRVKKIVLGQLKENKPSGEQVGLATLRSLPATLARDYPNLTHLYLWSLPALEELPELPAGLACLDVRGCTALARMPALPISLRTLIVERAGRLESLRFAQGGDSETKLEELSLQDCTSLAQSAVQEALAASPALQVVDLSGLSKLGVVSEWPPEIVDLRLNGCKALTALPANWPQGLRRLELRDATLTRKKVNALPLSIDFMDLSGMRRLRVLPQNWRGAKTLYLFGSACVAPPASEHGATRDENVAERTKKFFDDGELVGEGAVTRCKVLLLGNGGAGKTCLALNLVGKDPERTRKNYQPASDRIGSTHGVQIHRWQVKGQVDERAHTVAVHVWDFGGQEIYHNTHRLFLSSGTVFVLVWDPEPESYRSNPESLAYVDKLRSLGYWLDYVEQATTPALPEIVIVCSKRSASDRQALARMRAEAGPERLAGHRVHFLDSLNKNGGLDGFRQDLEQRVLEIVDAQGTAVPSYWEIAQDLVERWVHDLEEGSNEGRERRQMTFKQFQIELASELERRARSELRFSILNRAIKEKRFVLDEDRVALTLGFLTHGGWVFWDPQLLDRRVIIGQKWASEHLYTLLERDGKDGPSAVYRALRRSQGRFSLDDLNRWGWDRNELDEDERRLLITYLERIGLCFRLVSSEDSLWGKATYVSFSHLPLRAELPWRELDQDARLGLKQGLGRVPSKSREFSRMHAGHWDAILRDLGERFGTDGTYARDGFIARTKRGQRVRIEFDLAHQGFGGSIRVDVIGPEASSLQDSLVLAIEEHIDASLARRSVQGSVADSAGEAEGAIVVGISYAWEPESLKGGAIEIKVPSGYEVPVESIAKALREEGAKVVLRRDKDVIQPGDDILEFMRSLKRADRVVVVHSDKYWHSPFCMYEFTEVYHGLPYREQSITKVLFLISHIQTAFDVPGKQHTSKGPIEDANACELLRGHWREMTLAGFPTMLKKDPSLEGLKLTVLELLDNRLVTIASTACLSRQWIEVDSASIAREVVKGVLGR